MTKELAWSAVQRRTEQLELNLVDLQKAKDSYSSQAQAGLNALKSDSVSPQGRGGALNFTIGLNHEERNIIEILNRCYTEKTISILEPTEFDIRTRTAPGIETITSDSAKQQFLRVYLKATAVELAAQDGISKITAEIDLLKQALKTGVLPPSVPE